MTRVEESIEINALVEKIFTFATKPNEWSRWVTGVIKAEQQSEGPLKVGSTIKLIYKSGETEMEWLTEVFQFEENKKYADRLISGNLKKYENMWTYESLPSGGTKVVATVDYELPYSILGKIMDKLKIGKEVKANWEQTLKNLKELMEK